jgi:HPt (histidine-containing phosphotransfer) domain-containing protein/HAMP domain-containing protein
MKLSIWKKILFFVVLPFLVIYLVLSVFIIYQVYQTQIARTRQRLYTLALYNNVNLNDFYDVLELSIQISAAELETIDPNNPEARKMGEPIITTRFRNDDVSKVWFVFEPNAFDGRDAFHTDDYSGAPSGRYMRFFNRDGNSWHADEAVSETDSGKAYWYVMPRDSKAIFTDLGSLDYGNETASSINVSGPVFRDNEIIGCVGLTAVIDENTLGDLIYHEAVSAIFLPDGRLGYSRNIEDVGKTLEDLGFSAATVARIQEAMEKKERIYLANEYSGITHVQSYNYFYPVQINGRDMYIYTSLPQSDVWLNTVPVIKPVGISLLISLIIFSMLLLYLAWGIAEPLKRLTLASETLASGNLDVRIDVVRSGDELGMITKSLSRMAEQFRVSKLIQERYEDRFDIIIDIHHALFRSESLDEAFNTALTAVAKYFGVFKATLIYVLDEGPRIVAVYPFSEMEEGLSEFFNHNFVAQLLEKKKHLVMNYGTIKTMQMPFVDYQTRTLCILPLRMNEVLKGYIIMEGKEPESFVHDDTTLLFLGETLSYIIGRRADWEAADKLTPDASPVAATLAEAGADPDEPERIMPDNAETFLEKAKTIQNLNVDMGLLLIGGGKEQYAELLRVTIKVIAEGILKMRRFYIEDLPAFAIEIHGMKGALASIGVETLADEAKQLEFAAKSDDALYCRENYPGLEEKLRTLSRNLASLFPQQERGSQGGDIKELAEALVKIRNASNNFDSSAASSLLAPMTVLKWDEGINSLLDEIEKAFENIEYDEATAKISELIKKIGDEEV